MIRAAVARSWGAGVAKACKQAFPDCSRCRRPQNKVLREAWGCDAPAQRVVWESSEERSVITNVPRQSLKTLLRLPSYISIY